MLLENIQLHTDNSDNSASCECHDASHHHWLCIYNGLIPSIYCGSYLLYFPLSRFLTYCYLLAFNAWLLLAPIVLCYDWQVTCTHTRSTWISVCTLNLQEDYVLSTTLTVVLLVGGQHTFSGVSVGLAQHGCCDVGTGNACSLLALCYITKGEWEHTHVHIQSIVWRKYCRYNSCHPPKHQRPS